MAKATKAEKQAAIDDLRAMIKPGDTLWTVLRHVSKSGMMRHVDVYLLAVGDDGKVRPRWLSRLISRALGYSMTTGARDSLKVPGCGMDVGFKVVYNLGAALWPNGTPQPHGTRNGSPDSAGGYALRQEWL